MKCPICKLGQIKASIINSREYTTFIYCLEEKCGFSVSLVLEGGELSLLYRKSGTVVEAVSIPHNS